MIDRDDVLAIAGELDASGAAWARVLAFANSHELPCDSDEDRDLARVYLAAHIISATSRKSAGIVTSEQVGSVRRTYASIAGDVSASPYGPTLALMLRASSAAGPHIV